MKTQRLADILHAARSLQRHEDEKVRLLAQLVLDMLAEWPINSAEISSLADNLCDPDGSLDRRHSVALVNELMRLYLIEFRAV